jgi:hypothetical protein
MNLCAYSRARGGVYMDVEGRPMTETFKLPGCPLGLGRKFHDDCPCARLRKVGEQRVNGPVLGIYATSCTFPFLPMGEVILARSGFASWVRRQHLPPADQDANGEGGGA